MQMSSNNMHKLLDKVRYSILLIPFAAIALHGLFTSYGLNRPPSGSVSSHRESEDVVYYGIDFYKEVPTGRGTVYGILPETKLIPDGNVDRIYKRSKTPKSNLIWTHELNPGNPEFDRILPRLKPLE